MRFVSRRKWLWNSLLTYCQQIAYSLFWKGCRKTKYTNYFQNSSYRWYSRSAGRYVQNKSSNAVRIWHVFWKLYFQYEKFLQFLQSIKKEKFPSIQWYFCLRIFSFHANRFCNMYWYKKILIWFYMKAHFLLCDWPFLFTFLFLGKSLCVFFNLRST